MTKLRLLCVLLLLACLLRVHGQDEPAWQIRAQDPQGEIEIDPETGTITASKGVILTYGDVILTADQVTANERTGDILAEGSVVIKTGNQIWRGERINYNFQTGEMTAGKFKTGIDPLYVAGEGLRWNEATDAYSAYNATVTTDNYLRPGHKIRAKELTLVPNKYFELRHATLLFGEVPVFYWPYYKRNFGRHPYNFVFTPGYRSNWGPYLLSRFNWTANENLEGSVNFDLREKRGIGLGPEFEYRLGKFGDGTAEYYFADDQDSPLDSRRRRIDDERHRFRFMHMAAPNTNLTFKTAIRYQSDEFIIRDFFETEYRDNVQPSSFVELSQLWPNFTLDALVQPQINDFFETVERLPDIKLTALRQQIGATPLYYEGENSFGYFAREFATGSRTNDFAAMRGDSFHQILWPGQFLGWLNFTPRLGGRVTYYGEATGTNYLRSAGALYDEETRNVLNTGAELSFKASRVWQNLESRFWDVDGLRHIIEPAINYSFVPNPTVRPRDLPQFDYELQTLRPLPIEFPDYNSIDSIDSQNVIRFMVRNRVQTRREGSVENLLNWALFTDWRLDPRREQRTFNDLFSDLEFRPRSWLRLHSETRVDINDGDLLEANHRLSIQPTTVWSVTLGHRFLDDPRLSGVGHNLIYDTIYYRFNENWAARMSHYFEARDGTMEEQYYTLYRDLRSWTAALTVRIRDHRARSDDFTIALTFSLKAFPRVGLGGEKERPGLLLGS